jgi:hypothetical protein
MWGPSARVSQARRFHIDVLELKIDRTLSVAVQPGTTVGKNLDFRQ